ncbi:cysteine-rich venom protein Mr30-like [Physella acuta]|uniref:cysteine-rich venom protein Mr30-like n=1 Tax=Physella acuta TaxID=109671 RepID=UPI0027DE15FC|nr:cysteine-rich venom protein Mr30-like [Physella acuta]
MWLYLVCFVAFHQCFCMGHQLVKRETNTSMTCECSPKLSCSAKYQKVEGHTACLTKSAIANSTALTAAEKTQIVDLHNTLRGQVTPAATDMLKLTWDDELAMLAQHWSDACRKDASGNYYHDSLRYIPGSLSVGQNMAWGHASFSDAINDWNSEKSNYVYGTELSSFDPNKPVGHYTQLVWANTSRIGCGFTLCGSDKFYVCNYAPAGNIMPFAQPYRSDGAKCSRCQTCFNGALCDCANLVCENWSAMDVATCTCACKVAGIHVGATCKLSCLAPDPYYCGNNPGFTKDKCLSSFISSSCPHLCGICPCADTSATFVPCKDGCHPLASGSVWIMLMLAWILSLV